MTQWDIQHAAGEAIANAVEHGFREGTFFEIRARFEDSIFWIEVEDHGRGFDTRTVLPRTDTARGLGIGLMRRLADDVRYFKHGRVVRLEKRLAAAAECVDGAGLYGKATAT